MNPSARVILVCAFPHLAAVAACGGTGANAGHDAGMKDAPVSSPEAASDAVPEATSEAGTDGAGDASGPSDGTPMYTSVCTQTSSETGTIIDTEHGRLDGYLSFVVPIGGSFSCNGDSGHVHLQIRALGNVYDVAVDTGQFTGDVNLYEADMPMPDGPWSEGWHRDDGLTYTSLGIHSSQFTPENPASLGAKIATELAGKNHVSIFGTGYPQGNGCHDVHYHSGNGQDGAMVIDPLSSPAHMLFFRFSTDTF